LINKKLELKYTILAKKLLMEL